MVLLTSSSISVAASGGVVCIFTFLLFLSGYVLQQQTVRSMQAAIHPPPRPTPTLPVYFQEKQDQAQGIIVSTDGAINEAEEQRGVGEQQEAQSPDIEILLQGDPNPKDWSQEQHGGQIPLQPAPSNEAIFAPTTPEISPVSTPNAPRNTKVPKEDDASQAVPTEPELDSDLSKVLAYAQLLGRPSEICSALLFFKLQRQYGNQDIGRLVLYPSFWEEDDASEAFRTVLALMQSVQDEYKITFSSAKIDKVSSESSVERDLLGQLVRNDWNYGRIIYPRSPGLALDIGALDSSLHDSQNTTLLSEQWKVGDENPVSSVTKAASSSSVLLISEQDGIYVPRGRYRHRLTADAITTVGDNDEMGIDDENDAENAAYLHFYVDGEPSGDRSKDRDWYGSMFEKYERGRADVCRGFSFEGEGAEMRRLRRKGRRKGLR